MRYKRCVTKRSLHSVLRELGISDEDFAAQCGQHRTEIWAYRTGRRMPRADTADAMLAALRKLGVDITLGELVSK